MNIIENSMVFKSCHDIKVCYQNSALYKATLFLKNGTISLLKNSDTFGFIYIDSDKKDYFKNSMTYKILMGIFNVISAICKTIADWSKGSLLINIFRAIIKFGDRIISSIFKVYKYSIIYNLYLDWIESEKI